VEIVVLLVFLGLIFYQMQKNKEVDAMGETADGAADAEGLLVEEGGEEAAAEGEGAPAAG
jgi:hypothetical protein